ncbi:MAG: tetratricopeptide repeat protein [Bacteroidota bacterium]
MQELKYLFLLCCLSGWIHTGSAQQIEEHIEHYHEGSIDQKIDRLFLMHNELNTVDDDTLYYFIEDLHAEGANNSREDALAFSNYIFGHVLNDQGLYQEALAKLTTAKKFFSYTKNDSMLAEVFNAMGNNAYLQSERIRAEEYYLKSHKHGKRTGKSDFRSLSSANLARIYISQEKYDEAEKLLNDYIEYNQSVSNVRNLGTAYGVLGQLYLDKEEPEKASELLEKSMEFNLSTGQPKLIANGYTNLAIVAYFQGDYSKAQDYFELSLSYRKKSGDQFYIAESYYNLGDFYFGINELDSAMVAYEKSMTIAKENDNLEGQRDVLWQMSILYDSLANYRKQAQYLKEYIAADQAFREEKVSGELAALRMSFQQELQQQSYLSELREQELQQRVEKSATIWDYWLWIVVVGILILALIVFKGTRATKKEKNKQVREL